MSVRVGRGRGCASVESGLGAAATGPSDLSVDEPAVDDECSGVPLLPLPAFFFFDFLPGVPFSPFSPLALRGPVRLEGEAPGDGGRLEALGAAEGVAPDAAAPGESRARGLFAATQVFRDTAAAAAAAAAAAVALATPCVGRGRSLQDEHPTTAPRVSPPGAVNAPREGPALLLRSPGQRREAPFCCGWYLLCWAVRRMEGHSLTAAGASPPRSVLPEAAAARGMLFYLRRSAAALDVRLLRSPLLLGAAQAVSISFMFGRDFASSRFDESVARTSPCVIISDFSLRRLFRSVPVCVRGVAIDMCTLSPGTGVAWGTATKKTKRR